MRACVFCNALSPCPLCDACAQLLPLNGNACPRCANPLPATSDAECGRCLVTPPAFIRAVAPLLYEFPVDTAIKALKFRRELCYVPVFGDLLLRASQRALPDVAAIVPVPLHFTRHVTRGFNQAFELARRVARGRSLPLLKNVRRIRSTRPQSELSADEREHNLRAAFEVRGRLHGESLLVIDDVMTTGATCNELATTLLDAGAGQVSVLTIARAIAPL